MKRSRKHLGLLLHVFLFLLCSAPAPLQAQAKAPVKIRLATSTAGLDFAPIWIAQRKGYFKEENIDFEHILTTGGAVTMAAIMNGDVQFVATAASDGSERFAAHAVFRLRRRRSKPMVAAVRMAESQQRRCSRVRQHRR